MLAPTFHMQCGCIFLSVQAGLVLVFAKSATCFRSALEFCGLRFDTTNSRVGGFSCYFSLIVTVSDTD